MSLILWVMLVLLIVSAFLSSSESAYFSLSLADRRQLAAGHWLARRVAALLDSPDRLLGSILLGNLVVNLTYFTLSSIVSFKIQQQEQGGTWEAFLFAIGSLMVIMVFAEMLPKDLAVLAPRLVAQCWAMPLTLLMSVMRPVLPLLHWGTLLSRRLFVPRLEAEEAFHHDDLYRTVTRAHDDAEIRSREYSIIRSIVALSELKVDGIMRPRRQLQTSHLPLDTTSFLHHKDTLCEDTFCHGCEDFVFVTEETTDDIVAAVRIVDLLTMPHQETTLQTTLPLIYIPWSATAAGLWEQFHEQGVSVAAVVNEYGETIGAITEDDLWRCLFYDYSR